jgi:uncharacterized damage-inducible protein DinB
MAQGGISPANVYEYLVAARTKLFDWVRPLSFDQYTREFPFGVKSLRRTLVEIAGAEWNYNRRLRGEQIPEPSDRPFTRFLETDFAPLEQAWKEQVEETRRTLREITDWSKPIEYAPTNPPTPTLRLRTTAGGVATQLLLHEVHHRAQAMAMLRQLGVPAQNLDYSIFAYQRVDVLK